MNGDVFRRAYRNQPFLAGDAVRIIDGPLANLTGVFVRAAARNRCIITIDGEGMG